MENNDKTPKNKPADTPKKESTQKKTTKTADSSRKSSAAKKTTSAPQKNETTKQTTKKEMKHKKCCKGHSQRVEHLAAMHINMKTLAQEKYAKAQRVVKGEENLFNRVESFTSPKTQLIKFCQEAQKRIDEKRPWKRFKENFKKYLVKR